MPIWSYIPLNNTYYVNFTEIVIRWEPELSAQLKNLAQAVQESGAITTIPRSAQKMCECGTWRHGLVVNTAVLG